MRNESSFSNKMTCMGMICALLVIWIHAYNIKVYNDVSSDILFWIEEFVSQFVARMAVPFFFMSSAFFCYRKSREKKTGDVYKSRGKSVLLPYLLWNTIYLFAYWVLTTLGLSQYGMKEVTLENVLKGIFFYEYNYTYWFMFYLIVFIIMYPIIKCVLKLGRIPCLIIEIILVAIYVMYGQIPIGFLGYFPLESFVYYFGGAICGCYFEKELIILPEYSAIKRKMAMICFFCVAVLMFVVANIFMYEKLAVIRNLSLIAGVFLLLDFIKFNVQGDWWKLTFMIYSIHPIVLEMVEKLIFLLLPHNMWMMLIDYVVAPMVTMVLIYIICKIMKKMLPRTYRVLNGGR